MWAHKSISGFKLCTCGQTTGIDPISVLWGANGSYSPKQQTHLKRGAVATAKVVSEVESIWLKKSKEQHWTAKPLCCFTLLSCCVAQQHHTDMDTWLFYPCMYEQTDQPSSSDIHTFLSWVTRRWTLTLNHMWSHRAPLAFHQYSTRLRFPQRTAGRAASPGRSWKSPSARCSQIEWPCGAKERRAPSPSKSPVQHARGRVERWRRYEPIKQKAASPHIHQVLKQFSFPN